MELSNINKQTFQGIRIGCRVPEPVKDAVQRSEILQKLGNHMMFLLTITTEIFMTRP
jgi:hypothetical protein